MYTKYTDLGKKITLLVNVQTPFVGNIGLAKNNILGKYFSIKQPNIMRELLSSYCLEPEKIDFLRKNRHTKPLDKNEIKYSSEHLKKISTYHQTSAHSIDRKTKDLISNYITTTNAGFRREFWSQLKRYNGIVRRGINKKMQVHIRENYLDMLVFDIYDQIFAQDFFSREEAVSHINADFLDDEVLMVVNLPGLLSYQWNKTVDVTQDMVINWGEIYSNTVKECSHNKWFYSKTELELKRINQQGDHVPGSYYYLFLAGKSLKD